MTKVVRIKLWSFSSIICRIQSKHASVITPFSILILFYVGSRQSSCVCCFKRFGLLQHFPVSSLRWERCDYIQQKTLSCARFRFPVDSSYLFGVSTLCTPKACTSVERHRSVPIRQLLLRVVKMITDEEPLCILPLAVSHSTAVQQRHWRKPEGKHMHAVSNGHEWVRFLPQMLGAPQDWEKIKNNLCPRDKGVSLWGFGLTALRWGCVAQRWCRPPVRGCPAIAPPPT